MRRSSGATAARIGPIDTGRRRVLLVMIDCALENEADLFTHHALHCVPSSIQMHRNMTRMQSTSRCDFILFRLVLWKKRCRLDEKQKV
jgi:hypothetical protein